tara:strand:- start:639 stop:812 length:174 start_codon:yes stop_codon:yes gene_type:complete
MRHTKNYCATVKSLLINPFHEENDCWVIIGVLNGQVNIKEAEELVSMAAEPKEPYGN